MPPGMPDTSVKHMRLNLSPCLLQLPGELLDAGNCLQLVGALLQNHPEVFSGTGLCAVPGQTSCTQKKSRLLEFWNFAPILHLFGRAQGIST